MADLIILGRIRNQETIAVGRQIREIDRLRKVYGPGRWRKRKDSRRSAFLMAPCAMQRYIGTKHTALVGKRLR